MNWHLILDFTEILIWPAVTFIIVIILRQPIIDLLGKISSVNFRGLDVKFVKGLDRAEAVVASEEIIDTSDSEGPDLGKILDRLFESALEAGPAIAVIHEWASVEAGLNKVAESSRLKFRGSSPIYLARSLANYDLITKGTAQLILELRQLRNIAVHEAGTRRISENEARRFRDLAREISYALEITARQLEANDRK